MKDEPHAVRQDPGRLATLNANLEETVNELRAIADSLATTSDRILGPPKEGQGSTSVDEAGPSSGLEALGQTISTLNYWVTELRGTANRLSDL